MLHWEDVLKKLLRRGKVYAAAVLDHDGRPLLTMPELVIKPEEGEGLVRAVTCNYRFAFKLLFNGTLFTCFHKDKNIIVGLADETVLVGKEVNGAFIVGLALSDSPGSCIFEVTEVAKTVRKRVFKAAAHVASATAPAPGMNSKAHD
ncbi:hypothetical protein C0Q70_16354 [Pomacea canaliculata]|uniref:Profilin n=1 Tax=Pomacea canaliculata TaxID=400727 RepID=A0A2T7NPL6_POMCA|nr:uncharacterized protein LOC112574184 [Pomacea canaliculata]PVD23092.1 hypothetical protein C0Q70_16354 [Pomacea canaliculata]